MKNRLLAFLVALVLCLGTVTTAFALSASTSRSTCRSQWTNFTVQKYGGSNNTSESVRAIKVIISGISNHLYEEVMNSCNGFSGTFSSALKNAVIHAQQDIFKNDSSQWDGSVGPKTWGKFYDSISGPYTGKSSTHYWYSPAYSGNIGSYHIKQKISNAAWGAQVPGIGLVNFEWP